MDLLLIGSANQYAKRLSLQNQWRMKRQSGDLTGHKKPTQDHVNFLSASDWLPDDEGDDRLSAIVTKAQAGRKLSPDEWDYLKAKAPELYEKLKAIEQEAEAYEKSLKRCKTRDEAQRLHVSKLGEILTSLKDGDTSALYRLNRMSETMTAFTKSKRYHELPTEAEEAVERESERRAKQEALREEAAVKEAEREEREAAARAEDAEEEGQEDVSETEDEEGSDAASGTDADREPGEKVGSASKTGGGTGIPSDTGTGDASRTERARRTGSTDGHRTVSAKSRHTIPTDARVPYGTAPHAAGRVRPPDRTGVPAGGTASGKIPPERGAALSFGQRAYLERRDDGSNSRRRRRTIDTEA